MQPFKAFPVGTATLDLYPAAKPSFPAPWMRVDQLLPLTGHDPSEELTFVQQWPGGALGPWVARANYPDGSAIYLVPAAAAVDLLNRAPAGLDPATREAIEAAFATRTANAAG